MNDAQPKDRKMAETVAVGGAPRRDRAHDITLRNARRIRLFWG
jgi:hypothetical protein